MMHKILREDQTESATEVSLRAEHYIIPAVQTCHMAVVTIRLTDILFGPSGDMCRLLPHLKVYSVFTGRYPEVGNSAMIFCP